MSEDRVEQQEHGYLHGHQLLSASLRLPRDDQDTVDRLSDMAGPLRPGETFSPYLTAYPLPSRSYYVIARTWQDLDASRAGCVLTRSILVPMVLWETIEDLDRLLSLLVPVVRGVKVSSAVLKPAGRPPPIVQDPRAVELVEAMFFESRKPIVFYEAPQAEAITVRILTALWPSIRRNFAACTFALSRRKIEGRDFDLVFAPKTARTRFADWPGRRIDVSSSKAPRHRWSVATAFQIFQSDTPSLTANDALGILKGDARSDESALRLSLLWNELAAKAETTPTAVLGMLDILNSRREIAPELFERLSPIMARAAKMASEILPEWEAWRFLVTLLGKLTAQLPPKSVLRKIEQSATSLAKRNPEVAFEFLEAESQKARTVPAVVLAGLGNGLSSSPEFNALPDSLARLPAEIGLSMFALSARFARSAVAMAKRKPLQWISCLVRLLEAPDRELRRKARRRLTPLLDHDALAPLLPPALDGVAAMELAEFAVQIGRQTNFDVSAFDEPLGSAAKDAVSLEALRNAVATSFSNEGADRFLFSTLRLDGADIAWLCSGALAKTRARRALLRLLEEASDRSVLAVQRDVATRERLLELLLGDLTHSAEQIARILTLGELRIEPFLEIAYQLLPLLEPKSSGRFVDLVLGRALAEAEPGDKRVSMLVAQAGAQTDPRRLVQMAAVTTASPQRVGDNVVVLEAAPAIVRNRVIGKIDDLSDHLVRRTRENLGEAAYIAWAAMIADAGAIDRDAQIRAAMPALAFALRSVSLPVSGLIVTTFPIVYEQLLKSKGDEDFGVLPALLALPLSFFADWDRAKAARRDLVDAFMRSSWLPADLLLAAIGAGIEQKILKRLRRKYRGDEYIVAIGKDSLRLKESARKCVQDSLAKFRLSQPRDDWD